MAIGILAMPHAGTLSRLRLAFFNVDARQRPTIIRAAGYKDAQSRMRKAVKNPKPIVVMILALLFLGLGSTAQATEEKGGLFINLTTDDTWAAAKAILFAHERVLKRGYKPVAIWLNVRGIYLADKKRPSHVHGLMKEEGKSIQDMLQDFMKDGGMVIACMACSQAAGLTQADFIDGVQMGNPDLVMGLLFDPSVKTLSW